MGEGPVQLRHRGGAGLDEMCEQVRFALGHMERRLRRVQPETDAVGRAMDARDEREMATGCLHTYAYNT